MVMRTIFRSIRTSNELQRLGQPESSIDLLNWHWLAVGHTYLVAWSILISHDSKFYFFCNETLWLVHHNKILKHWTLPNVGVSARNIGTYKSQYSPTYISSKRKSFGQSTWDKVRCSWEHIENLGNLVRTHWIPNYVCHLFWPRLKGKGMNCEDKVRALSRWNKWCRDR
jgi:hypothetical protein